MQILFLSKYFWTKLWTWTLPSFSRDWTHSCGSALSPFRLLITGAAVLTTWKWHISSWKSSPGSLGKPLLREKSLAKKKKFSRRTNFPYHGGLFHFCLVASVTSEGACVCTPAPTPSATRWHVIVSLAFWSSSLMENVSSFVFIMHALFEVVTGASARLLSSLSRLLFCAIVLCRIYSEERV